MGIVVGLDGPGAGQQQQQFGNLFVQPPSHRLGKITDSGALAPFVVLEDVIELESVRGTVDSLAEFGSIGVALVQNPLGRLALGQVLFARVMRFAVQTLNRHGLPAHLPGTVMLHAAGPTRERLLSASAEGHAAQHAGDGRFHLHDLAVRLAAHEVLPFHVEFLPAEPVTDFAVRVVQYVETRRGPRLVGGQTFVVGKVRGFPVR